MTSTFPENFSFPSSIPEEEVFVMPTSFSQQRLWFLDQLEPDQVFNNQSSVVKITGQLDISALEKSFNEIVRRHEILRTSFGKTEEYPEQIIRANLTLDLPVLDLRHIAKDELNSEVERLAVEHARTNFNLAQGALLRISLLQIDQEDYILLVTMHHIISDGWSKGIFIGEIAALYESFSRGKASTLPDLSIQYADYAVWQRRKLQGEFLENLLIYWKKQLSGATPLLELTTDRPRPSVQKYRGSKELLAIPKPLTDALKKLTRQENVTLFMTLLAAFKTLLYRYTNQTDILVGSPIANRQRTELEPLIGLFVNTLVLRTDLGNYPSFQELLKRVNQVALDAYAHQDLPFEKLVEELQPERNLSYSPLFQVMFVLHNAPMPPLQLPGLTLEILDIDSKIAQFDLTLHLFDKLEGLSGWFEYNTDLFDSCTIKRLIQHFLTLLEGIVAAPEQKISDLPLLTPEEQHQLIFDWNKTQVNYPLEQGLHELIEAQVQRTPEAIAVIFENQHLTYNQLNIKANQLAHYLQKNGVKPDQLVGVFMERSFEMVIALLGILKAGGAYVPLDPTYPLERLAFMIEDAQFSIILTQQKLIEKIPNNKAQIICLDQEFITEESREQVPDPSQENPNSGVIADNLAYVIYTSGSTGKPKGAMNTHRGICNRLLWMQDTYQLTATDRVLQKTPFSFDVSVWEFFWPLLTGASLIIAKPEGHKDTSYLINTISHYQITTLHFVPSMLQVFLEAERLKTCSSLRQVICSGEALPFDLQQSFFAHFPTVKLHNLYGPTEAAIDVTFWECQQNSKNKIVPIGRPIANTQLYILDEYLQPTPIGIPGELHIGGVGLAKGYLNRPELTEQKFIPNPFDGLKSRLYKTGDLVRYLKDGNIEYIGRIDHQVKIRGFRIELGEIETALTEHLAVKQGVVIAREKQLIAYLVPETHRIDSLKSEALRRFLKDKLPDYMIPAAFVILEALPITHNGKIDRKALANLDITRPDLESTFVEPRTSIEKLIAQIWQEVLGLETVGIKDNFFALGGDSIRSIKLQSLAEKQGLSFSIQDLFKYQTIEELAQSVNLVQPQEQTVKYYQPFSLISEADKQRVNEDIEDAYPLVRLQMGMLFHSEYTQESATYHDIFSFYLKAPFNEGVFADTIQELVTRHQILRTSFDLTHFSEPLQLIHRQSQIPLAVEDWRNLPTSEQEATLNQWLEAEKERKFDVNQPSLLRFHIHRRSDETFQFTVSFHHAILDGWSVALMLRELFEQYLLQLKNIDFCPQITLATFRDFVRLEQEAIASVDYQQYWHNKLTDCLITKLPRWTASHRAKIRKICTHEIELNTGMGESLKQLATSIAVPLKSVLLAAHLRVLSLLNNQSDIITGLVVNGRPEQADGERVLGMFLNTVPFRFNLSGGSWIELIQTVFAAERDLLPWRRYPLAELQKNFGTQPLFEAAFNFVNFHIYQGLDAFSEIEVLEKHIFEATDIPLFTDFSVDPFSQQIKLILQYDVKELCSPQIENISGYYLRTLETMVKEPLEQYQTRSLLSSQEKHQQLHEWNNSQKDYPQQCVHELFEAQAERTPDAVAVVFEHQQLTYRELNERANQLAHYLQTLGVQPEVIVGLCVERSLEMIVGILAILKAGGAYVPIDPIYPQERINWILQDAQVPVLLTQEHLLKQLPQNLPQIVCMDRDWTTVTRASMQNPHGLRPHFSNLAYIIYTSGSTGKPKGVAVTHWSLANYAETAIIEYGLKSSDRLLQFASISFDAAIEEIFPTLILGATLVLRTDIMLSSVPIFLQQCAEFNITVLDLSTAFWHFLTAELVSQKLTLPAGIGLVIIGGEKAQTEVLTLWQKTVNPTVRLFNSYGPTETTVVATLYNLSTHDPQLESLPIGRPIRNVQTYILDQYKQPVPVGVTGELYIGGVGVARGYLNRPELTTEKFISHPFNSEPGARLYKTGDLARYLSDGNIEFLGRIDDQIKIRGFRIELAEIESLLRQYPPIRNGVVIMREDQPGEKRLVAYLVRDNHQLKSADVRSFLKEKLPDYMIPSAFVFLDKLPLTANGKIDKKSLPSPPNSSSELEVNYVKPQSKIECQIAQIWQQILSIEKVGIYDNFFDLGGHSLLLMRVYGQLQHLLSIELSMVDLFRYPTISTLAQHLTQHKSSVPKLTRDNSEKLNEGKTRLKQRLQQKKQIR